MFQLIGALIVKINVPKMTKISDNLKNWSFEIMDRDEKGIKEKYLIKKIPTFIIYDETGKELEE